MCLGGGVARMTPPQREYQNRPVTVTGSQTGVDDPKDTKKATETLKIQRKKEEGTYVEPNLITAKKLTNKGGSNQRSSKNRARNLARARSNRQARSNTDSRSRGGSRRR